MKHFEWVLSAVLIVLGILFMALSCTPGFHAEGFVNFIHLLLLICLWIAIPFLIVQFIYAIFFKKRKKE